MMRSNAYTARLFRASAMVIVLLAPVPAISADPSPMTGFSASYTVGYGILRGAMSLRLETRDNGYVYDTSLAPRGLASWLRKGEIRETTRLRFVAAELQPVDYESTDTIARPERRVSYRFDQDAGKVTGEYKSQAVDMPMRPGGQNRISAQVAIMRALQTGQRLTRIPVFDRARWREFEFEVVPDQTSDTPAGRFDTVEVRYASPGDSKTWSLFCAPALNYLPVMIVYTEDGKVKSRAELKSYRLDDAINSQ